MKLPEPVLIIGCGLMGTSLALALREHDVDVMLSDVRAENVRLAVLRGAGRPQNDNAPAIIVVAVPPTAVEDLVVGALTDWPAATVTDVTSVKANIGARVARCAGAERYVGSHPMAGSERSGPMAASEQLFQGRSWAITASVGTCPGSVNAIAELARLAGAAVIQMDANDHDEAVALVSHLPHLLSVLTASQLHGAPPDHLALAGPGLRDVTRVAGSDTALWQQILASNPSPIRARLEAVRDDLDMLISALGSDADTVASVLSRGRTGTELIPGKHGGPSDVLATVYVQVPDRPGSLSTLMAQAKDSGVNIEDLRIEHGVDRPIGVAEVTVSVDAADTLEAALEDLGWSVYQ